jgi:hypothetical protein
VSPRIALVLAGLAALALPLPGATVSGIGLTGFGLVCLAASVSRPGSTAPALLIATAALSWLATPDDGRWPRLAALALAVAVVHSAAALAAVVPATAPVPAAVTLRWAGWTTAAAAAGVSTVAAVQLLPGRVPAVLPTAVTLAVLAAVLVAVVLSGVLRRRTGG